jgi:hypothetical protein
LVYRQLGKWLPILSRVVIKTVLGKDVDPRTEDAGHWNVVQNNGLYLFAFSDIPLLSTFSFFALAPVFDFVVYGRKAKYIP